MMIDADTHHKNATRLDTHRALLWFLTKLDLPCLRPVKFTGCHIMPFQERNDMLRKNYLQDGKIGGISNV